MKGKRKIKEVQQVGEDIQSDSDKETKSLANEIREWNNTQVTNFTNWFKRATDNIGLVYDEHWSKKDEAKHEKQDRTALNMPGIFAKVLNLTGFEKNNRLQFEADPVGEEDELLAEIFNFEFRHIESQEDPKKYKYTKSDVFSDGIIPLYGAAEIYTETDDIGENEIKIRDIPYNELVFERNFTDVEMTACNRIQHFYDVNKDELKYEYSGKEKEIDQIPIELLKTVPKYTDNTEAVTTNKDDQKYITKIRDFHRVTRDVHQVHLIVEDQIEEYYNKAEADERIKELIEAAKTAVQNPTPTQIPGNGVTSAGAPQVPPADTNTKPEDNYILKTVPKRLWEYTVAAGDVILEESRALDVGDECPIKFYFSIFIRGKVLTIIDIARHLQQYYDKIFSQMDFDIGTDTKITKVLYTKLLDEENQTISDAMDAVSEGGTVLASGLPAQGSPVGIVQRSGMNRDYAIVFKLLQDMMDDTFGGQYFLGATSQDMSGKAIGKMQAAAALIAINYMDNLGRFDEQVGRCLIKYIKKFYTSKHTRKVLGENMTEEIEQLLNENKMYKQSTLHSGIGWVIVNDPMIPSSMLSDANLNIILNSVSVRQDEKDVEYQKLLGLKQQGYGVPVEALLDTMNLKATLKNKIVKETERQQAMQEKALQLQEKQATFNANLEASKAAHTQMNTATNAPQPQDTGGAATVQQ